MEAYVQLDMLVARHIMKWPESNMVEGKVAVLYHEPLDFIPPREFSPTRNVQDAMEAAMVADLFERYALHAGVGAYNGTFGYYVSEIDQRGVLQGFVAAGTPALAITHALLNQAGVDLTDEQKRVLTTY